MARPTKLTPEVATGIVTLIRHAVHPTIAAAAFGVAASTFYEWIARGEGRSERGLSDPIYLEFADAVAAAEEQAESALVTIAIDKVKTTGDAIMILERRFADRWKRREEMTVNIQAMIRRVAEKEGLSEDEIMREVDAILASSQ